MDKVNPWKQALRQGNSLVLILVVAGIATIAAYLLIPTFYTSNSTLVLAGKTDSQSVAQQDADPAKPFNPLLGFDARLKSAATVIVQTLSTPEASDTIVQGLPNGSKVAVSDTGPTPNLLNSSAPFIYLTAQGISPSDSQIAAGKAVEAVRSSLAALQTNLGTDPTSFVVAADVVPALAGEPDTATKIQEVLAVSLASTLVAYFVAVGIARRSVRKNSGGGEAASGTPIRRLQGDTSVNVGNSTDYDDQPTYRLTQHSEGRNLSSSSNPIPQSQGSNHSPDSGRPRFDTEDGKDTKRPSPRTRSGFNGPGEDAMTWQRDSGRSTLGREEGGHRNR